MPLLYDISNRATASLYYIIFIKDMAFLVNMKLLSFPSSASFFLLILMYYKILL